MMDRPAATLADAVAEPRRRWLLPALLALVATVAAVALTAPFLAAQAQQAVTQQLNQLPSEQLAQFQNQMAFLQSPLFIGGTAVVSAVFGLLVGWLAQAALFYFGALIAGSDVDFRRLLSVTPWVNLPFVWETILQAAYALFHGGLLVNQGLSYLVSAGKPLEDARSLAYVALSQVSLFRLWHLLLVYLLFRVGAKVGGGTAFWLTLLYAALGVGVQLALAALAGALTPML